MEENKEILDDAIMNLQNKVFKKLQKFMITFFQN